MSRYPQHGLFVVGTDTGVGKTYVAGQIAKVAVQRGKRVGVYKPVASGCCWRDDLLVSEDAVHLWEQASCPATLERVCPQRFEAPLVPHRAAMEEGKQVDVGLLQRGLTSWTNRCDMVVVEGAGGLLSPLSDDSYVADLAVEFGYPLIVVAPNRLGVINQTLQTLMAARHHGPGLRVAAVLLNDVVPNPVDLSTTTNFSELRDRCDVPIVCKLGYGESCPGDQVDWCGLAECPEI